MRRTFARGEGKAGCVIWTLILLFAAYAAYSIVPIQMKKAQFKDYVDELVLHNNHRPAEWIQGQIAGRAEELRLPVERKNIKVTKRRSSMAVEVQFTTVIDFILTDYVWDHEIIVDRESFVF